MFKVLEEKSIYINRSRMIQEGAFSRSQIYRYKSLKKIVKRMIFQEVSVRKFLPEKTSYEHERPQMPGAIGAEEFTRIIGAWGHFTLSLLIDVAGGFCLGTGVAARGSVRLVQIPVLHALDYKNGCSAKCLLISDNGSVHQRRT